jgi:hypothetical protein
MLHNPTMDLEMKYPDGPVKVPGFPSLHAEDFSDPMKDKNHPLYPLFLGIASRMFQADRILINTFQELEHMSIQALVNGELRPSIDCSRLNSVKFEEYNLRNIMLKISEEQKKRERK